MSQKNTANSGYRFSTHSVMVSSTSHLLVLFLIVLNKSPWKRGLIGCLVHNSAINRVRDLCHQSMNSVGVKYISPKGYHSK